MTENPIGAAEIVQVVRGHPTPEELAAVLVVLAARAAAPAPPRREPANGWSAYWRTLKAPLAPGPGAWRGSAHPR